MRFSLRMIGRKNKQDIYNVSMASITRKIEIPQTHLNNKYMALTDQMFWGSNVRFCDYTYSA